MADPLSNAPSGTASQPEPPVGYWAVTLGNEDRSAEGWLADQVELRLDQSHEEKSPIIIGIAGSVAVGKTNLAGHLAVELTERRPGLDVVVVASDSFLMSNHELERLELSMRKGFPETFDYQAMAAAVASMRQGQTVSIPEYSHVEYDIIEGSHLTIDNPDVVILEGVNVLQEPPTGSSVGSSAGSSVAVAELLDLAIYIDADTADIEAWFVDRFLRLCEEAGAADRYVPAHEEDFYAGFVGMTTDAIRSIAEWTWREINEPNLRDHIRPSSARANVIIQKDSNHQTRGLLQRRQ